MRVKRMSHVIPAMAVLPVAMVGLAAGPALADGSGGHSIVRAALVGSMPAPASPTIAGVAPGGAPWVNGPSEVRVRADGRITVTIRGLVIPPPRGTAINPIPAVVATLVCDDVVKDSTAPFALSAAGDGSTADMLSATRHCEDATVLIQPAANRAVYIAASTEDDDD